MDNILLIVFGTISALALGFGVLCTWMAVRAAKGNKKDADVAMALWSMGSVAGFAVAAVCMAYFVIPIVWHRMTN
ncbi:hypothetical protein D3C83_100150 [compost metagenome]